MLAAAQLKLDAALPAEMRARAALVRERFHLDAPGWYYDGDSVPHLSTVADTVWKQRRIEVQYRRWRAPTDVSRSLDPHGIVLKAGKTEKGTKAVMSHTGSLAGSYRVYSSVFKQCGMTEAKDWEELIDFAKVKITK